MPGLSGRGETREAGTELLPRNTFVAGLHWCTRWFLDAGVGAWTVIARNGLSVGAMVLGVECACDFGFSRDFVLSVVCMWLLGKDFFSLLPCPTHWQCTYYFAVAGLHSASVSPGLEAALAAVTFQPPNFHPILCSSGLAFNFEIKFKLVLPPCLLNLSHFTSRVSVGIP